jgi:hypothetical protein
MTTKTGKPITLQPAYGPRCWKLFRHGKRIGCVVQPKDGGRWLADYSIGDGHSVTIGWEEGGDSRFPSILKACNALLAYAKTQEA